MQTKTHTLYTFGFVINRKFPCTICLLLRSTRLYTSDLDCLPFTTDFSKMTRLRPSEIRYVQDSINNVFDKRCNHPHVPIGTTLDKLCEGRITIDSIPRITVCQRDGKYWSADNRRLWVFQEYERLGGCTEISVLLSSYWCIPSNKFTTYDEGKSVQVRRNPGGLWYRKPDNALNPKKDRLNHDDHQIQHITPRNPFSRPIASPEINTNYIRTVGLRPTRTESNIYNDRITQPAELSTLTRSQYLPKQRLDNILANSLGYLRIRDDRYLDPSCVKYTKKTIPSTFYGGDHRGESLKSLVFQLMDGEKYVPPITVYRVWDDDRVIDGNRRLWAYRMAQTVRRDIRIPVVIKTDEDEYQTKFRENNSKQTLSLKDILLFDGDDVEVIEQ